MRASMWTKCFPGGVVCNCCTRSESPTLCTAREMPYLQPLLIAQAPIGFVVQLHPSPTLAHQGNPRSTFRWPSTSFAQCVRGAAAAQRWQQRWRQCWRSRQCKASESGGRCVFQPGFPCRHCIKAAGRQAAGLHPPPFCSCMRAPTHPSLPVPTQRARASPCSSLLWPQASPPPAPQGCLMSRRCISVACPAYPPSTLTGELQQHLTSWYPSAAASRFCRQRLAC